MKDFSMKKMKAILLSGAMALLAAVSLTLGFSLMNPFKANAATLLPTDYRTDGASVRVLTKNDAGEYEEATKQGIRFHVEMGAGYTVNETVLFDTETTNANGSYKIAEGYKTYTLAIPTRLLDGELTVNTAKVRKIDTTNYWFTDANGNWESVAYIHSFPVEYYTDALSFRGVICAVDENGNETPVAYTDTAERSLTWVAKKAYNDTIDENSNYWGTAENDTKAAPIIKKYIPTYTVDYGAGVTEDVMWGEKLTKVDKDKTYYDETHHEPVEVKLPLTYPVSAAIKITEMTEGKFVFTGVKYTDSGFNVFTTLPASAFTDGAELSPSALDMVKGNGEKLTASSVTVDIDGADENAKVLLAIEFPYEGISYGDSLTILHTSHFYNNGYFYEVEKDYTFVFYNQAWELALGEISIGDIESIKNYTETVNGEVEKNIRITFRNDIMVNGSVTIGTTNGNGGITIARAKDNYETVEAITDGYYYWNQGQNMILELPHGKDMWGESEEDILTIKAGTRLYQNNGFYEVKSDITATFDGAEGNKGTWAFELEEYYAYAEAFVSARTIQEGDDIYIDMVMVDSFADETVNVVCNKDVITYYNTDNVTSYVPSQIDFHGENGNKLLRIHIDAKSVMGDKLTIPVGTELWMNNWIVYIDEALTFYYVEKDGGIWVMNPEFNEVNKSDFVSIYWAGNNIRYDTKDIWSTAANNLVVVDDTYIDGDGVILEGSVYSKFYYYGATNRVFEMQGVNFMAEGGSATLKDGVIFWLFSSADGSLTGAYKLTEDIALEVSGANGSQIYKDVELLSINKKAIASVANDRENNGEIRFNLNGTLINNVYSGGILEGSATLNGEATTTGHVYGGDGTSGYSGSTIVSFTGTGFGKAFQATKPGDRVVIEAGTKIWLNNGEGYITIADTWDYTWTGERYVPTVPADTKYTVSVNANNATVEFLTDATVAVGGSVTFKLTANEGFAIGSVPGATANGDGSYTISNIYDNKTVNVQAAVRLEASSIKRFYTYIGQGNDTFVGIRVEIKDTAALRELPENYGGQLVAGEVTLVANGATVAPTSYHSYGPNNLLLGFVCEEVKNMVDGDSMTIKAGALIKYGNVEMYVAEDITCMVKGGGFVQTGVERTVSFNVSNASITENGTTVTSIKVMAGEDATFSVVADSGYAVASVTGATKNDDGSYTVKEVYADATVTVKTVKVVNISQEHVVGVINEAGKEIRISLNKDRADISAITGEYYGINFNGTVALTINGQSATPTQYNYYGVIGEDNYQLLGVACDVASMKADDSLTIKAGSSFTFAGGSLYVTSDITIKMVGITVQFDDSLATLSIDKAPVSNNSVISKFAYGSSTIEFGWIDINNSANYSVEIFVNGQGQGYDVGTVVVALSGNVTIKVELEKKYTTKELATNMTSEGTGLSEQTDGSFESNSSTSSVSIVISAEWVEQAIKQGYTTLTFNISGPSTSYGRYITATSGTVSGLTVTIDLNSIKSGTTLTLTHYNIFGEGRNSSWTINAGTLG